MTKYTLDTLISKLKDIDIDKLIETAKTHPVTIKVEQKVKDFDLDGKVKAAKESESVEKFMTELQKRTDELKHKADESEKLAAAKESSKAFFNDVKSSLFDALGLEDFEDFETSADYELTILLADKIAEDEGIDDDLAYDKAIVAMYGLDKYKEDSKQINVRFTDVIEEDLVGVGYSEVDAPKQWTTVKDLVKFIYETFTSEQMEIFVKYLKDFDVEPKDETEDFEPLFDDGSDLDDYIQDEDEDLMDYMKDLASVTEFLNDADRKASEPKPFVKGTYCSGDHCTCEDGGDEAVEISLFDLLGLTPIEEKTKPKVDSMVITAYFDEDEDVIAFTAETNGDEAESVSDEKGFELMRKVVETVSTQLDNKTVKSKTLEDYLSSETSEPEPITLEDIVKDILGKLPLSKKD